jgi:hypothetical protein
MQIDPISVRLSNSGSYSTNKIAPKDMVVSPNENGSVSNLKAVAENYNDRVRISKNWEQRGNDIINAQNMDDVTNNNEDVLLLPEPENINIGLLSSSYISDLFSKELIEIVNKLNEFIAMSMEDKMLDDLRAEGGAFDALDSNNDHEIAIVGPIYKQTPDEIIDIYLANTLFKIKNILGTASLASNSGWGAVKAEEAVDTYIVYSHIFNLILFFLLLTEKLPLGRLSFQINSDLSKNKKNYFEINLSISKNQVHVDKYKLTYDIKNRRGELFCESRNNTDPISYEFSVDGQLKQFYGSIHNHLLIKKIVNKKNERIEKIIIGGWKLDKNLNDINEPRKWEKKNSEKVKVFQIRSTKIQKYRQFYLVSKYIQIGEDYILEIALFKKGIPMPIAGGGVIINNTESAATEKLCLPGII